jgi:hypothetical protein
MANEKRKREQLTITLNPDEREDAERVAAEECRSLNGQIRYWILNGLADHEAAGQEAA